GQLECVRALGKGAGSDADDLELLREAFRDAGDHVGDQRALQAVQGSVRACVVRSRDLQRVAFAHDRDVPDDHVLELALRALHPYDGPVDRHLHAARNGDRLLADSRHLYDSYQTWQSTSPPTLRSRASRSVRRP